MIVASLVVGVGLGTITHPWIGQPGRAVGDVDEDETSPVTNEICEGTRSTLADVGRQAGFPFVVPDLGRTSDQTLKSVWECLGGDIALAYDSGMVIYEYPETLADPVGYFEDLAKEYPDQYSVGTLDEIPVSFGVPGPGAEKGGHAVVEWSQGAGHYMVKGAPKGALDDVTEVADAMISQLKAATPG
jgi:hypothetical protein